MFRSRHDSLFFIDPPYQHYVAHLEKSTFVFLYNACHLMFTLEFTSGNVCMVRVERIQQIAD